MTFPGEDDASAGFLEKFGHCLSDTGAGLVHQRLDLNTACKCSLFCGSHLRRSQNWQVQINPPVVIIPDALLCLPVPMKSSSSVEYSSWLNALTGSFWNGWSWFGRCTVATGCFRLSQLESYCGSWRRNCGCACRLQSLPQSFDDRKHSVRTQPRLG